MHPELADPEARDGDWYSYAIVRVVPWVERGEQLNVGVILFSRTHAFLQAGIEIDVRRLRAFAPRIDVPEIVQRLDEIREVCAGQAGAGPIARLSPSERFHWLTSPRSTVIQTSAIHTGLARDPAVALDRLLARFVRPEDDA